jgi:hypothetical protein
LSPALKPLKYFGAYLFCRQVTLAATIRRARTLAGLCNAARQALLGERRLIEKTDALKS